MKTVFFDVDTQLDFLFPAGALYVPGAERIAPALAELTQYALLHRLPVLSTLDSHIENDPEFQVWKPHCILGTQGHRKYSATLLERNSASQILFEKNTIDFFPNPELHGILDRLAAQRFVVYGLVTEYCVQSALFGLLSRNVRVDLVTDAVKSLDASQERSLLERFTAQGGRLLTVRDVLSASPDA